MACDQVSLGRWMLGIFLALATVISFFPQYDKIRKLRTHRGLSLAHFCLEVLVNFLIFLCYLATNYDASLDCCVGHTADICIGNMLPLFQLTGIWISASVVVVMYLRFFDRADATWALDERDEDYETGFEVSCCMRLSRWRFRDAKVEAHVKAAVTLAIQVIVTVIFVFLWRFAGLDSAVTQDFAEGLAAVASFMIAAHWAPQIWLTYRLGTLGALSFIMILLHFAGLFLTILNVCDDKLPSCSWYKILPYTVALLMVGSLVGMTVMFFCVNYRRSQANERIARERTHSNLARERTRSGSTASKSLGERSKSDLSAKGSNVPTILIKNSANNYRPLDNPAGN